MKQLFKLAQSLLLVVTVSLAADGGAKLRKAPDLTFELPGKGTQSLSQYQGKVIALEFIFTTCPHCQAASRYMTKLQAELGSRGLQAIDIAVNPNADLLVDNFIKDYSVGFPVGWTTSEKMTAFMGFPSARYVVPQLVLIDRRGYIHWQTPATEDENWDKLMNQEAIRQHIEELLGSNSTSAPAKRSGGRVATARAPQPASAAQH